MARLRIFLLHSSGNKMHWQIPSPRAVVNTDPYELIYLARDVGALESNMVRGTPLGSDEYHLRSVWLQFSSSKTLPP